MANLVYKNDKIHKFWNISVEGSVTTRTYGKFGKKMETCVKDH